MEVLNENLSKDIHTAVRKVAKQMETQSHKRKQPFKNNFTMPAHGFEGEMPDNSHTGSRSTLLENSKSRMDPVFSQSPNLNSESAMKMNRISVPADP